MAKQKRIKNARPDVPDIRDRMYEPALVGLASAIPPPQGLNILDQGSEGACTGFSLAATINRLCHLSSRNLNVSPRMLYEMAKRFDEWPGESYEGSSLRGAIRGWKNMGVCSESKWPYTASPGQLTISRAREAKNTTVGAYYRVRPIISDFHAALNEVGIIAVTAQVHKGWDNPKNGKIKFYKENDGGHAFAIVGYNDEGFWIQNSWDVTWGKKGLALWSYEDWVQNVMDAWVVRLALPTPQIFGKKPLSSVLAEEVGDPQTRSSTPRAEIAGHFVHIDDGHFEEKGRYWSNLNDVKQTAKLVAESDKYDHLMVYAHGGLNSPKASASRIRAMKDGFKRNGVYPFHIMYDTGLAEEFKDLIIRKGQASKKRVGGITDWTDRLMEGLMGKPGTLLWDEMKRDADDAFKRNGAGTQCLRAFIKSLKEAAQNGYKKKKIHLVGHSTGGILLAHLIKALSSENVKIDSCGLLAPACSVDLYHSHYLPSVTRGTNLKLDSLHVHNLNDSLEKDDNVAKVYRKSLLYLVSNAFERQKERPLLGMEKFLPDVRRPGNKIHFHFSDGTTGTSTRSKSHGGFDNDPFTMNHVLKIILGNDPSEPFSKEELTKF